LELTNVERPSYTLLLNWSGPRKWIAHAGEEGQDKVEKEDKRSDGISM